MLCCSVLQMTTITIRYINVRKLDNDAHCRGSRYVSLLVARLAELPMMQQNIRRLVRQCCRVYVIDHVTTAENSLIVINSDDSQLPTSTQPSRKRALASDSDDRTRDDAAHDEQMCIFDSDDERQYSPATVDAYVCNKSLPLANELVVNGGLIYAFP